MKCDEFMKYYLNYENNIPKKLYSEFDDHKKSCGKCSEKIRHHEMFVKVKVMSMRKDLIPGRDLWPGIMIRINEKEKKVGRIGILSAIAASFLSVLVITGYLVFFSTGNQKMEDYERISADYRETRKELLSLIYENDDILDRNTISSIENNLMVMDTAAEEIITALKTCSEKDKLLTMLSNTYKKQEDLLVSVNSIIWKFKTEKKG